MKYKDIVTIDNNYNFIGIIDKIFTTFPNALVFLKNENKIQIDNSYFLHSATKEMSRNFMFIKEKTSVDVALIKIAESIILKFSDNWNKLFNAYFESDYNPIENYSMIEEETPNIKETSSHSKNANNKTSTQTNINSTNTNEGDESMYSFNSSTPTPTTQTQTSSTSIVNGKESDNYNKIVIDESESISKTQSGKRTLTRSGNIGVTTSQQMLESELKLREYDFYTKVFDDIDSILCSYLYNFN